MAAAHYRFKKDSLTYTPTGGAAVAITGVQSIRFGQGGETIDLMSDASELVQEAPLHRIKGRLTITTIAQAVASALVLGDGAIAFQIEQVKNGRGAVAGATKDVDFAACILKDVDAGVGSSAGETATLQLDAVEDGEGNIFTITTAA